VIPHRSRRASLFVTLALRFVRSNRSRLGTRLMYSFYPADLKQEFGFDFLGPQKRRPRHHVPFSFFYLARLDNRLRCPLALWPVHTLPAPLVWGNDYDFGFSLFVKASNCGACCPRYWRAFWGTDLGPVFSDLFVYEICRPFPWCLHYCY